MADTHRDPSLEILRKQARRWLNALRNGNAQALRRLEQALPRHSDPPVLREVQQALAREQGFPSWAALREHHALQGEASGDGASLVDVFLEHACIFSEPQDLPVKWKRAERILARHPEIATANVHTAVVCGEVDHVRSALDAEPDLVSRPGGPQRWEPLLFACYGRVPTETARKRSLEVAELLLDRGADPNAFFVMGEWRLRFTALTGAMGQGEMGQPEHPQAEALARLLLDRGARANDGQALYNTCLVGDDTRWLEILFSYGLGPDDPVTWHADPADAAKSGADRIPAVLDYLVSAAAANGHVRRLALLLEHGANPDAVSIYDGNTAYQSARIAGHREAAELLLRHGATAREPEGHDAFVAAVSAGDRERAAAILAEHPEYREIGDPLTQAARGETDVARLLLELGVDPNAESKHGHRALNNACQQREIAEMLMEHGADPRARAFGGTACTWARHADDLEMARFFAEHSRSLLDAATSGHVDLARELLATDPACIGERSPAGNGPLHELGPDASRAEPLIALLLAAGADPELRNEAGQTPAERLEEQGSDDVADLLEAMREEGAGAQ